MLKKILLTTFLSVFSLITIEADIKAQDPRQGRNGALTTGLNAVAMNAAAASRTFTLSGIDGYTNVIFFIDFSYAAATAFTLTCTAGPSSSDVDYQPTTCTTSAGTCEMNPGVVFSEASVSADFKYIARWDPLGATNASCVYSGTGGGANDSVTIKYWYITR